MHSTFARNTTKVLNNRASLQVSTSSISLDIQKRLTTGRFNILMINPSVEGIGFKIKILGRLEGGRRTRRTLTTDNASKIFILKPIDVFVAVHGVLEHRVVEQGNKDEFSGRLENMPKKALVVDNDFFFVEFLSELLEARGYHVIKAYDGKEAISQLEQEAVEVMFVDMVMPKIDGKELIRYSRSRFPDGCFPIIALSGVIVQQLAKLDEIGADYFIVKGPMEKMANHIVGLMDKIEKQHIPAATAETVFQPRDLISKQISDEFVQSLSFHRCITESAGVGIAVIDRDTRVITANAMALDIMNRTHEEVLNHRITAVFPDEKRETVIGSLNKIVLKPELKKTSFFVTMNSRKIRIIVSLLRIDDETAGWIIVMEDT